MSKLWSNLLSFVIAELVWVSGIRNRLCNDFEWKGIHWKEARGFQGMWTTVLGKGQDQGRLWRPGQVEASLSALPLMWWILAMARLCFCLFLQNSSLLRVSGWCAYLGSLVFLWTSQQNGHGRGGTGPCSSNMAVGLICPLHRPPSKLVRQEKGLIEGNSQLLQIVLTLFCLDTW